MAPNSRHRGIHNQPTCYVTGCWKNPHVMGIQLTYSFGGICWILEIMYSGAWVTSSCAYLYKTTENETRNGAIYPNLASPIRLLPARDFIFKHPAGMKTSNLPCTLVHSNHTPKHLYQSEMFWQYLQEDQFKYKEDIHQVIIIMVPDIIFRTHKKKTNCLHTNFFMRCHIMICLRMSSPTLVNFFSMWLCVDWSFTLSSLRTKP